MVDPMTFRAVMSQWPSGVTVVTTLTPEGVWHGMTASSFSSVSLDPPLVSICLTKTLYAHELVQESGVFGINVLAKDQIDVGHAITLVTFQGLDIDAECHVRGEDGEAIEGLYAVGEVIGAGATCGNSFCSGMLLTPALTLGRLLGARLAEGV